MLEANPQRDEKIDAGLDVKYGLTSNLTLDLTANTDFAQVEADVEQINLTRFPLFFPERREFFLESASTFQFGEPGFFGPPSILLFFSRRIGIEGFGSIVPITAGGRLTGKVGRFNLGVLDILTDKENGLPRSHFSVARVSRDIFQRSKIGMISKQREAKIYRLRQYFVAGLLCGRIVQLGRRSRLQPESASFFQIGL
ncbi:MAG: DUF5916 domain-containing protein [bacterium]